MQFNIKKGRQFSRLLPIFLRDQHFGIYDILIEFDKIMPEQDYYNKLIGFGKLNPRLRSERIGWRFITDSRIEFCIYSEKDYNHISISPFAVPINFNATTGKYEVYVRVQLQHRLITASAMISGVPLLATHSFDLITSALPLVLCKPYHGGKPAAEQDYSVTYIKIL